MVALVLATGGCARDSFSLSPGDMAAQPDLKPRFDDTFDFRHPVWVEPGDPASAVGGTPPRVRVGDDFAVSEDALAELASMMSLRTWPENEVVDASAVISPSHADSRMFAYVTMVPSAPVLPRWYLMRIAGLPPTLKWPTYPAAIDLQGSAKGVRFHPASSPMFAGGSFCDPGPISLYFSERLIARPPVTDVITIRHEGRDGPECWVLEDIKGPEGAAGVSFACTADPSTFLTISVGSGLESPSGLPLRNKDGMETFSFRFKPQDLPPWGTGCRAFGR